MQLMDDSLFQLWRDERITVEDALSQAHRTDELAHESSTSSAGCCRMTTRTMARRRRSGQAGEVIGRSTGSAFGGEVGADGVKVVGVLACIMRAACAHVCGCGILPQLLRCSRRSHAWLRLRPR